MQLLTEVGVTLYRYVDPTLWHLYHTMPLQVGRHLVRSHNRTHHEDDPVDTELLCTLSYPTEWPE